MREAQRQRGKAEQAKPTCAMREPAAIAHQRDARGRRGRRFRLLGTWLRHRHAARPKGLDREPGPSRALAPAARASSPQGDFARRDRS